MIGSDYWPTIQCPPVPSDAELEGQRDAQHAADVAEWMRRYAVLEHYADEPVTLEQRNYHQLDEAWAYGKPDGLWLSVAGDDDWPSWCRDNEFDPGGLTVRHRVVLDPGANILRLSTVGAMRDFDREFGMPDYARRHGIRWGAVAQRYDGIMIAPFHRVLRFEMDWYYGWDCASACVWNLNAISRFHVMEEDQ